jgi:phospholipase/lecithinase/hemolysin
MKNMFVSLFALVLTLCLPAAATAAPFSQLVIFSGSLTDTGNFASVVGNFPPPYYNNRSTNGLNLADVFAESLGFNANPSLHLIGPPQGNNFAVLGALARGTGAAALSGQITAHLNTRGGSADPNALYFMFIGGNDVIEAALTPDDAVAK